MVKYSEKSWLTGYPVQPKYNENLPALWLPYFVIHFLVHNCKKNMYIINAVFIMIKSKRFISLDITCTRQLSILKTFVVNNHITTHFYNFSHYKQKVHLDKTYNYCIKTYIYEMARGQGQSLNIISHKTMSKKENSQFSNPFLHDSTSPCHPAKYMHTNWPNHNSKQENYT